MRIIMTIKVGGNVPEYEIERFSKMTDDEIRASAQKEIVDNFEDETFLGHGELVNIEIIRDEKGGAKSSANSAHNKPEAGSSGPKKI